MKFLSLFFLLPLLSSFSGDQKNPKIGFHQFQLAHKKLKTEIAASDDARHLGLGYRKFLPDDHAMIFLFPDQQLLSFWMMGTEISLDIAFLDDHFRVQDIYTMDTFFQKKTYSSTRDASAAIEVRENWFRDHQIGLGSKLILK